MTTRKQSGLVVKVKRLTANAKLPEKQTEEAACFDVSSNETVAIRNLNADDKATLVHTGLAFEIPKGYHMKVFLRSSVGLKTKLRLANQTGIIDSDYRGEITAMLVSFTPFDIEPNTQTGRVAVCQGRLVHTPKVYFDVVDDLSVTSRGTGGFGHTGM